MSILRQGSAILRAPEGDPAPGSGGTDFTEEQLKAIGAVVNTAFTNRIQRDLPKMIADGLKATKWDEVLAPVITSHVDKYIESMPDPDTDPDPDAEPKPGKKPKGGKPDAIELQLQKLATELENERKARAAAEDATKAAEQKRLQDNALTAFRNALQPKVRGDLLDLAVSHYGREMLKVGEDGQPLLRVKRAPYKGAPEEEVDAPLAEALPLLLSSEGFKALLPAPGSGNVETRKPGGGVPRFAPDLGNNNTATDPASKALAQLTAAGVSLDDV